MSSPRVLVVDDEADLCELLEITLVRMGLDVDSAGSLEQARRYLAQTDYALVLTDMRLPDGSGVELVTQVSSLPGHTPIAVITAFGSADNAVAALKAGAFDYLSKPVALDQLRRMVQSAVRTAPSTYTASSAADSETATPSGLIGRSLPMQLVREQIRRLARSMAPVAITGESGTGKELAAREIHALSSRADKPFVAVNCGAIPEALMEAEFFGYRKGAFTGAAEDRPGLFQAANGGTLLLDEVADLPLAMQVKLLRAIQERRVRKVGATTEEMVDVRLVSATHQNLEQCVANGTFRQDLYYRLNVIELRLPPLRDRLDDIDLLADAILRRLAGGVALPALAPSVLAALRAYSFPGNVRELENILERALAFASQGVVAVEDLVFRSNVTAPLAQQEPAAPPLSPVNPALDTAPPSVSAVPAAIAEQPVPPVPPVSAAPAQPLAPDFDLPSSLPAHLDQIERDVIRRALARTGFNRTRAAELLGISCRQLRYRMQRLSIREQR